MAAKRKGRPPKLEEDRASINLTMRLRPALYEEIRSDADRSGRSISAQAEIRLQNREPGADDVARMIGLLVEAIERSAGKSWKEDDAVRRQCRAAADVALTVLFDLPPATEGPLIAKARKFAGEWLGEALVASEDDAKLLASVMGEKR